MRVRAVCISRMTGPQGPGGIAPTVVPAVNQTSSRRAGGHPSVGSLFCVN